MTQATGRLAGRTAIVTGAAYGERDALGAVFAKMLTREGAATASTRTRSVIAGRLQHICET
jgi:hypothetical protein